MITKTLHQLEPGDTVWYVDDYNTSSIKQVILEKDHFKHNLPNPKPVFHSFYIKNGDWFESDSTPPLYNIIARWVGTGMIEHLETTWEQVYDTKIYLNRDDATNDLINKICMDNMREFTNLYSTIKVIIPDPYTCLKEYSSRITTNISYNIVKTLNDITKFTKEYRDKGINVTTQVTDKTTGETMTVEEYFQQLSQFSNASRNKYKTLFGLK